MTRFAIFLFLVTMFCVIAGSATAQIVLEVTQRRTECLETSRGGYASEYSAESGSWNSDIGISDVGAAEAHQSSVIQSDGSNLVVGGNVSTSVVFEGNASDDAFEVSSTIRVAFHASEASVYTLEGDLSDHGYMHFRKAGEFIDIDSPGPFNLSGVIETGVYYSLEFGVVSSAGPAINSLFDESASIQLGVQPEGPIPVTGESWGEVKVLYR